MLALIEVVGTHDRPCATLLNCCLERRKVDFIESSVIDDSIVLMTLRLLVIERIMLHAYSDTILLNLLNIRHYHLRSKERILAHVLEVTTIKRSTVYVHARAEKHVLIAVARLLTDNLSVKSRHFLIPCSCKAGKGRESDA